MTETTRREFRKLAKPDPRGHKYFGEFTVTRRRRDFDGQMEEVVEQKPGLWIADDSAGSPEYTDDGPLKIIDEEGLQLFLIDDKPRCGVKVWVERRNEFGHTMMSVIEAAWVVAQTDAKVVMDKKNEKHFKALKTLLSKVAD